ncbi:hypothetical protein [Streptomyces sp. TRM68416]|uniref:hypothetical protein n=1 Tax=Streptomyces sp. TRM68416 TaxID=2758412 RepID=UPI0016621754|nr:hypothetical protein [Streptomyces sp. TRM68416]MBD0837152.1 hypothetical protein [Streptomyces sp. TRM68416]
MTNSTAPKGASTSAGPPPATAAEAWLASAHPSPDTVRREWDGEDLLALIPLGRHFDVVCLHEHLVHHVAGTSDRDAVNSWLGSTLSCGPVIHDPKRRCYYALVPPGTAKGWRGPAKAKEYLGEGFYLGVPRVGLTEPGLTVQRSYWAVPVTRPEWLCKTHEVLSLVEACRYATDDGEDR